MRVCVQMKREYMEANPDKPLISLGEDLQPVVFFFLFCCCCPPTAAAAAAAAAGAGWQRRQCPQYCGSALRSVHRRGDQRADAASCSSTSLTTLTCPLPPAAT